MGRALCRRGRRLLEAAERRVVVVLFQSGRDAMQALLSGSADFSASTDTPLDFRCALRAAAGGDCQLQPIFARHEDRGTQRRPSRSQKSASLKGRRLATRIGTSGQYLIAKYLELAGLSAGDVSIVDLAPNNMATALTRGDIDGFCWSSQTVAVAQRQSGGKVAEMNFDGIERYFQSHQLLLTTEAVIEKKPELIQAALTGAVCGRAADYDLSRVAAVDLRRIQDAGCGHYRTNIDLYFQGVFRPALH